jgi:hypothetical protein
MPAGNPYGSFVSHPAASQQQPPVSAENGYGGGPYTSQQVPGGEGWYPSAIGNGHSQPSRGQHAMPAAGGYLPAGQNGYDQQAYRTGQHEAAGYPPAYPAAQYDQGGYPAHDPRYSREAYQGYPGHGTGGY